MKAFLIYAMKNRLIICCICSLILLFGCDENLSDEITPSGNTKLKRVLLYGSVDDEKPIAIVKEYEYDSLDRISRVSSPMYEDGEIVGTISHDLYEYNSAGQLIEKSNYNANSNAPSGFIHLRNYTYTYGSNGKVEKETISYPQIGSADFYLYFYDGNKLIRIEKYERGSELERFVSYEYDNGGKLVKETSFNKDNEQYGYTEHFYTNGLNTESKVYGARDMVLLREIYRTYDDHNNLIILDSNEIAGFSSMMSHVLKYEYY